MIMTKMFSDSSLQLTSKKLLLVEFWSSIKELSEKGIRTPLYPQLHHQV